MGNAEIPATWMQALSPEELAVAIRSADLEPCQLSRGPLPSRLARLICPQVCLDFAELGPAMLFNGAMPTDCYTLVYVTECPLPGHSFNFAIDHQEGYLGFFPPGGELDAYTPEGYSNATLTVPVAVFHAALERIFPEMPARTLKSGAGIRIGPGGQSRLDGLLTKVGESLAEPISPLAGLAARAELEPLLLDAFLGVLRDGDKGTAGMPKQRMAGRLRHLRRARDFIHESNREPMVLDDLSHALGLSPRGVELLFQGSFGIGPTAFIRHQRLHGVRRALLTAAPEPGIVKKLALEWGFWHMGHFSTNYRLLFGENPTSTLRQSQSHCGSADGYPWGCFVRNSPGPPG